MSLEEQRKKTSRREFLKGAAVGFGTALAGGVAGEAALIHKIDMETNSHWLTPAAMTELSKITGVPYEDIRRIEPNLRRAIQSAIVQELRRDTI